MSENMSTENPVGKECVTSSEKGRILLSYDQRLQLEEQIRMFIQLLTQFYLLSCRSLKDLNSFNESSKQILVDLKRMASVNNIFYGSNLTSALDIVNKFEKMKTNSSIPKKMNSTIGKTIVNSEVFIYPELLPICGFNTKKPFQKVTFTKAEDNLIALGLERFSGEFAPIHLINMHLLPCKKVCQIKFRIKNLKASKAPDDNPIKYYYAHKEAPPIPRNVKIFDPNNVRAPKDYPYRYLPEWMIPLISKSAARITRRIRPNSEKKVCKPPFILPKGITIQNGNLFHSSKEFDVTVSGNNINIKKKKIFEAKKNKYKPPFILPKTILESNKELHSDIVCISDLESNTKNNSRNKSKQDCLLKNDVTESINVFDNNSDESDNDTGETQDVHKHLVILNNKSSEYNSSEIIVLKNEIQDEPITEDLIVPDNDDEIVTIDVNDGMQNRVTSLIINDGKSNEKKHTKDVIKPSDVLGKTVINKNVENRNSTDRLIDRDVIKPLCMVDDENNKKREFNPSSTNLGDIEYHNQPVIELLNNKNNTFSSKKQKFSSTVDYFPDLTGNECDVIIKSEIIEEDDESVEEDFIKDCTDPETLDSFLDSVNNPVQTIHGNDAVYQNLNNLENLKVLHINEKNYLAESSVLENSVNIINEKECESLNNTYMESINSNNYSTLQTQFPKFKKYECTSERNSNFVETEIENTNILMIPSQCLNHIKQEITDDFEMAQACESAYDVDVNKSVTFIKPEIDDEKDTKDVRSTLNNNHIIKTVDYLQCSNDGEYGIIIKSEITEENTVSLEDVSKIDLNLVGSSSPTKDYKASLRKRNLRSVSQYSFTKKSKTLHANSYAPIEFPTSIKKSHDLSLMQKIKSNNENAETDFIGNVNASKKDISTNTEIILDNQAFLHGTSNKIFNKPVLKTTNSIIKSNSLEKAHLKKTNKRVTQTKRKKNYQAKRKLRRRS